MIKIKFIGKHRNIIIGKQRINYISITSITYYNYINNTSGIIEGADNQ